VAWTVVAAFLEILSVTFVLAYRVVVTFVDTVVALCPTVSCTLFVFITPNGFTLVRWGLSTAPAGTWTSKRTFGITRTSRHTDVLVQFAVMDAGGVIVAHDSASVGAIGTIVSTVL
jgi:hypothetical protein